MCMLIALHLILFLPQDIFYKRKLSSSYVGLPVFLWAWKHANSWFRLVFFLFHGLPIPLFLKLKWWFFSCIPDGCEIVLWSKSVFKTTLSSLKRYQFKLTYSVQTHTLSLSLSLRQTCSVVFFFSMLVIMSKCVPCVTTLSWWISILATWNVITILWQYWPILPMNWMMQKI